MILVCAPRADEHQRKSHIMFHHYFVTLEIIADYLRHSVAFGWFRGGRFSGGWRLLLYSRSVVNLAETNMYYDVRYVRRQMCYVSRVAITIATRYGNGLTRASDENAENAHRAHGRWRIISYDLICKLCEIFIWPFFPPLVITCCLHWRLSFRRGGCSRSIDGIVLRIRMDWGWTQPNLV